GVDALHGVQLAVEVLNGARPDIALPPLTVGRVLLDVADTRSDPQAGAGAAERLVRDSRVVALTGAVQSDVTEAASQRAERLSVPMVTGSAPAADLTARSLRWFWRVGPSDRTYADTYFAWLRGTGRPVSRVVLVHGADQASRDGAALVHRAAPADIEITEDMQLPADAADLTSEVLRLDGYHPDAVFVLAGFDAAALLVRTMARVGYTPPALLGLGGGFGDPRFAPALGPLAD